ncbi:MAG: Pyridine nucleotide-disulfide oxidoreductase, FAD/NAD(P)-binding domain protein [Acidobacteriaceae bacterium]|nr:Pyridine nucleotide-disulfide oxidoreductase, FAD/NAD(P)-binding domain protein [Acidobacteriaceae bacterium]
MSFLAKIGESMAGNEYDLVVIGSGPAGQKSAIAAAKMRKRVAVIQRGSGDGPAAATQIGGVCVHTGTIPSKTFRESVLYLTGFSQRSFYGKDYFVKANISMQDLMFRVHAVVQRESEVISNQLRRNQIVIIDGTARFIDPHTIEVSNGKEASQVLRAEHVMIACGTRPAHNPAIPLDGKRIFDSDQITSIEKLPREIIVVGAGVIGLEFASMFAALNVEVTLIDARPTLLDFADREIIESLQYQLRRRGTIFRMGEKVESVTVDEERGRVSAKMESGKTIHGEALLYTVGRQANTDLLNLDAAGITPEPRGQLKVNQFFQTEVPHIYAAGDVIGFPSLASTSMEQGRLASSHMFGTPGMLDPRLLPYGIYTIPEISMVGHSEEYLTKEKINYEVGISKYEELAKGQMLGDEQGMVKILFCPTSFNILGVHIIGDRAAEIVHIGQAAMSLGAPIHYFRDTVFNYPTLAEAYKVAALDGLNKC